MARVNVYLPDDLAADARGAGLNVSNIALEALRRELAGRRATAWLGEVRKLSRSSVTQQEALAAVQAARDELGRRRV